MAAYKKTFVFAQYQEMACSRLINEMMQWQVELSDHWLERVSVDQWIVSCFLYCISCICHERQKTRNVQRGKPRMYGIWESFHAILVALISQSLCFLTFLYAAFIHWKIIIAPYQRGHTIACQYTDAMYKWELRFLHVPKTDSETLKAAKRRLFQGIISNWEI